MKMNVFLHAKWSNIMLISFMKKNKSVDFLDSRIAAVVDALNGLRNLLADDVVCH